MPVKFAQIKMWVPTSNHIWLSGWCRLLVCTFLLASLPRTASEDDYTSLVFRVCSTQMFPKNIYPENLKRPPWHGLKTFGCWIYLASYVLLINGYWCMHTIHLTYLLVQHYNLYFTSKSYELKPRFNFWYTGRDGWSYSQCVLYSR